jgi:hypothetical protein
MGAELGDEVNCATRAAAAATAMQPLSGFSTDSSNAACFSGCDGCAGQGVKSPQ